MDHDDAVLVRECIGLVYAAREAFAARFYERFFRELPAARRLFVHDTKRQEMMLYSVLAMATRGLEKGRNLDEEMNEFGRRHAHIGAKEAYFPVFGSVFLETMFEFLPHCDRARLASSWWGVFSELSERVLVGLRQELEEMAEDRKLFPDHVVDLNAARTGTD